MSAAFAGSLSEQIVIERASGSRDALGLQQVGWELVARCRASIVQEGFGSEAEGQVLSAMSRFRVTIRRRDGIAIDQRVRWRERVLMVRQLNDDPRFKDRITLRCEELRQ